MRPHGDGPHTLSIPLIGFLGLRRGYSPLMALLATSQAYHPAYTPNIPLILTSSRSLKTPQDIKDVAAGQPRDITSIRPTSCAHPVGHHGDGPHTLHTPLMGFLGLRGGYGTPYTPLSAPLLHVGHLPLRHS